MDFQTILVSFVTSCIPAGIAYLTASNQSKSQLQQLEKNNQAELDKMKLEYELKLKERDNNSQNELVGKFFNGDLDLGKLSNSMSQLESLTKQAEKLKQSQSIQRQN